MGTTLALRERSCAEFMENLDNVYFFDDLIDEAYWNRAFKAEVFFQAMLGKAEDISIKLIDIEEFDYETHFYNLYKYSEKGLS